MRWLQDFDGRIVTTRRVLMEVANSLANPALRGVASAFLRSLESAPEVRIVGDSNPFYDGGLTLYSSRPDKAWSVTDCISFLAMSDEVLTEVLTGDHHFHQAGFTALFL